ncbi:peptidoglycan-binding domain-containing protein [Xanthomonas fragariae]|uniref:peptidoglycan-binding domain-containing protein n=1 Tax=Xanthomonas fragariae TaxID=48664 RepID=UPI001ABE7B38|nr:peptidoglycan-binding protein [Xanthomonas fragariae]
MADLTDNELRALAYYSIGVSSEGGDVAYQLSFAGKAILEKDGSMMLKPVANSGYSIGTLQSDLGQRPKDARDLVDSFQDWSKSNHQNWTLNDHQRTQFTNDLQRTGHHIRDPNYEHDLKVHANIPEKGPDLNQEFKSHLNSYLNSDSGKKFIHQKDGNQIGELIDRVSTPIKRTELYQKSSQEIQAKIFAATAKAFNQNEIWGQDIIDDINDNKIKSIEDINKKISGFVKRDPKHPDQSTYMESGRDAALRGAETFNALRNASEANPLHAPWQAVMANPLVDPTQLHADPKHPHLAEQYATVKAVFVDPVQGRAFVQALEHGNSHNYGDPAKSNSRGFYAEGKDFVQWDRDGHGRAFVGGQWSEVSRSELALAQNQDGTLDVNLNRNGQTHSLLHVTHPSLHHHSPASAHAHHGHDAGTLHQSVHAHATTLDQHMPGMPSAAHSQSATRHDNPIVGGPTTGHVPLTPPTAKPPHLPLTTTQPLEPGDRGAAVHALQQHLQTIGATDRDGNAIKDDRHYGPRTQQAVENFQLWTGRNTTGIADPGTLEALQTHAQFATRQKAQDLAPGRHLADHAQPASSHLADALAQHPAPPRPDLTPAQEQAAPKALEPYSNPNSPLHALYAQTKTTLEGKDVPMSEERLHQVVGQMALYDMSPGGNNQFAVKGDTLYVIDLDACYNRFSLDLREPAPSMQATLQHVQTQQQTLEAELTSTREPPSYSR